MANNNFGLPMFNPTVIKQMEKRRNDALKKIFGDEIKTSFLIKILNKVVEKHMDIIKYYKNALNFNLEEAIQGANDDMDYDICRHIVGHHSFNMLFLPESEKGSLQENNKYIEKLCDSVYANIKLREFGSSFYRNKSLFTGDRFLFFPIGHDLFVVTAYLFCQLNENEILKKSELAGFMLSMVNECFSVLTLIEGGLLLQAYPQARNLIELYFKYEVLFDKPKGLEEYYKFCDYEILYTSNNGFCEEFKKKYDKHKKECSITDYLHYGWIDSIIEFGYLEDDKKYSIPGLYNYLKMKYKDNKTFDELKKLHNMCHTFSHGSTITKAYPLESFFEIVPILYYIVRSILIDVCNIIKENPMINDINIKEKLDNDWDEFVKKSNKLTMEDVKKYYE